MRDDLRERRERTWELLVVMGVNYTEAVKRLASQFDCAEGTIKSDISRMEDWLPDLNVSYYSGVSRLKELREARQRLRQYEMMAQQKEDPDLASRINQRYGKNLKIDVELSQRLGLTNEEPTELNIGGDLSEEDQELLDEICGMNGETVDLEDMA